MKVVVLTNGEEGVSALRSMETQFPPKARLIAIATQNHILTPESILIDLELNPGAHDPALFSDAMGRALNAIDKYRERLLAQRHVDGLIFRRAAGGNKTGAAPLLENSFAGSTSKLAEKLHEWITKDGSLIESFVVQPYLTPSGCSRFTVGIIRSHSESCCETTYGWTKTMGSSATVWLPGLLESWRANNPSQFDQLIQWCKKMQVLFLRPCDIKFASCEDNLFMIAAHESPSAGASRCQVVCEEVDAGHITLNEAIMNIAPTDIQGSASRVTNYEALRSIASGESARGHTVTGKACWGIDTLDRSDLADRILFCPSLSELTAWSGSKVGGLILSREGPSSHIVVVARGLGLTVMTGIAVANDGLEDELRVGNDIVRRGEWITIDCERDILFRGKASLLVSDSSASDRLVEWASSQDVRMMLNMDEITPETPIRAIDGIGLCRSERHLDSKELASMVKDIEAPLPLDVKQSLNVKAAVLFARSEGKRINYRLLDLGDFVGDISERWKWRGIRWGIIADHYLEQAKAIMSVAAASIAKGNAVNLAVIAPFVSVEGEAQWFRKMIMNCAEDVFGDSRKVKIGVMIETAVAVLSMDEIAQHVDCLCIGTNDLTEQVWSIPREGSYPFLMRYMSMGLIDGNPFEHLGIKAVGKLIRENRLFGTTERPQLILCGDHASNPDNARLWSELGKPIFSVRPSELGRMRIALCQAEAKGRSQSSPRTNLPPNSIRECADKALAGIRTCLAGKVTKRAQEHAWDWARIIADRKGIAITNNWKFFKRDLAEAWFGYIEHKRFSPGWNPDDVLAYAESIRGVEGGVRFSLFPNTIACHARSELLPSAERSLEWRQRFAELDQRCPLEVFPQQGDSRMCFRAVANRETVHVEAGIGQAMYVFEQERGTYVIASCELFPQLTSPTYTGSDHALNARFGQFVKTSGELIVAKLFELECELGLEWLAVEGYYEPGLPIKVCDMDLPFDLAFHAA